MAAILDIRVSESNTAQETNTVSAEGFTHGARLTDDERKSISDWLLHKANDGKLPWGSVKTAATIFKISTRTVGRIWSTISKQLAAKVRISVKSTRSAKCGRKSVQVTYDQFSVVPISKRHNLRSLAAALNISVSTLHKHVKLKFILPHSNALKPTLREDNKIRRLEWIVAHFVVSTIDRNPTYHHMYDCIYIDEKLFYQDVDNQRIYMHPEEIEPHRTCRNKRFVGKVMFLAAVGRPRWAESGECIWDGKIGIFPFTHIVNAQRDSINRPRGTPELKPIEVVNREVMKDMLINTLLPQIRERWPQGHTRNIYIIQDNAKPHVLATDPDWIQAATSEGFNFKLTQQPPNSPDLNILDLGFFRSIQSLQQQGDTDTTPKLVQAVKNAFNELHPKTLSNVWMSLQYVMNEVLKVKGGNNYKLPHVNKRKREAEGTLPTQVEADLEVVKKARETITQWHQAQQAESQP